MPPCRCRIVFRNTCRFPTTIHVHGMRYLKDSEGAGYNDGTSGAAKGDDGVPTGGGLPHVVPQQFCLIPHSTCTQL
jgi:manganese oxidase